MSNEEIPFFAFAHGAKPDPIRSALEEIAEQSGLGIPNLHKKGRKIHDDIKEWNQELLDKREENVDKIDAAVAQHWADSRALLRQFEEDGIRVKPDPRVLDKVKTGREHDPVYTTPSAQNTSPFENARYLIRGAELWTSLKQAV